MIIHLIHYPVSAKKFVEPLVKFLVGDGIEAELWTENREYLADFVSAIDCPKRFSKFDLTTNPLKVLARLAGLLSRFLKLKPAAIHTHQSRAAFIPLLAAAIAGVPVRIYHNHGIPYLGYRGILRFLLWMLEFLNCRLATSVITVSKSIRSKMIQHHIVDGPKCQVVGEGSVCGIDLSEFSNEKFDKEHLMKNRRNLKIPIDAYVVLYVGRPFKRKGFYDLLCAWKRLTSSKYKQVLLIAGCTTKDVELASDFSAKDVIAVGYVKDLRPLYAASDVVTLPSYHEGLPYSLLEAAAAAKPLVGSNVPGIDSVILNNKNGLLVPVKNPSKLADAFVLLRDNPDLRTRMGQTGRRLVEQHFDRKTCQKQLLDYYSRIGLNKYNG